MGSVVLAGATSGSTTITPTDAVTATVTLPSTGGTLQTSGAGFTTNGVAYASSTSALTTGSALTFDGSNLGLGVTPPASGSRAIYTGFATSSSLCMSMGASGGGYGLVGYNTAITNTSGSYNYLASDTASAIQFYSGGFRFLSAPSGTAGNAITFTQAMTLDASNNLLVGTTSSAANINSNCVVIRNPSGGSTTFGTSSTSATLIDFQVQGGIKGSISSTTSTTTYATSSDYRLKENIAPMTGALAKVAALKPVTYTWKESGVAGQGFIAHELQAVVPECVTGEKDAVDENGNPKYQGIDTSFLVATLTSAIQELSTLITAQQSTIQSLTERITALEGART